MRYISFTYIAVVLLALMLSACGGESSGAADDNSDGDIGIADGDYAADGDLSGPACASNGDCTDGLVCDLVNGICSEPECRENGKCMELYGEESYCSEEGVCVNGTCFGASDCSHGTYCSLGYCRPLPSCDKIADARILNSLPLIRAGKTIELKAAAYDNQGVELPAINGLNFEWESMNSDVVAVKSEAGTATGGELSGTTTVMMRLKFADAACSSYEITDTLSMQNFATYNEGARVIVVDSATDQPVGGATVVLNGSSVVTPSDADCGVALFEGAEAPFTVHVFHENYHYFSITGISGKDILIPLKSFDGPNRSAGVKGSIDYAAVEDATGSAYNFGIVGTSLSGRLLSTPIDLLFSPPVLKGIPKEILGEEETLLPSNIELFDVSSGPAASSYMAEGSKGPTAVWAWAGYVPSSDMQEILTATLEKDWDAWGALLFSALSFSENFSHGMLTDLELNSTSMVPDNGSYNNPPYNRSDLNGNGDPLDLIPDYNSYLDLGDSLKPVRPMSNQIMVEPGHLPTFGQDHLDGTLVVVGSNLPGGDFIPLGIGVGDENITRKDDTLPGGATARMSVSFTPYYGGLSDEYTLISYAIRASRSQESIVNGPVHSAVIHRFSGKIESVVLPDYLDVVPYASFNEASRTVTIYAGNGADFYRVVFSANGRRWDVLADVGYLKELDVMEFSLPVPLSDDPCNSSMAVYAVDLAQNYSLDSLAAFDDRTLSGIDLVTDRISVYNYSKKKK